MSAPGFEGPVGWLLELVESRRINLSALPIGELMASFAEALEVAMAEDAGRRPLTEWAGWVVSAARVVELASRLLVPATPKEAQDAAAEAERLRAALVYRQAAKAGADWLEARLAAGQDTFPRGAAEDGSPPGGCDVTDLLAACLSLMGTPEALRPHRIATPPYWTVAQAMARIRALTGEGEGGLAFGELMPEAEDGRKVREAASSTLVATMELAKQGEVTVAQEEEWGALEVTRRIA